MEATLPRRPPVLAARYLLLALLVHAIVLLLPVLKRPHGAPEPARLSVELQRPPTIVAVPPVPAPGALLPEAPVRPPPSPAPALAASRTASAGTAGGQQETRKPLPSAARLLDSLSELQLDAASGAQRPIERATSSATYAAMRRPVLELPTTLFSAYTAPLETEIVDRWQEPGGVHRVVIRTPSGATLCGRQEPVDEFRPWTQMPMLFNECAGGGKR